jgi:hypothetical protein
MRRKKTSWSHIVAYSISVILIILIGIKLADFFKQSSSSRTIDYSLEARDLDIVFGDDKAPLQVFVYSDYSCFFCRKFFQNDFPKLKTEYIDNGKIKLIMRLASRTENLDRRNALKTAVCINKYGIIDYLHELMILDDQVVFTPQFQSMMNEFIDRDPLVAECILGNEAEEYLRMNLQDIETLNIKGTPTFIINTMVYTGYKDYNQLKKIIEMHVSNQ